MFTLAFYLKGALKAKRKSGTDDVDGGKVKKPRKESNKEAEKSAKGAILPLSGNKKMASERMSLFESLGSPILLQEVKFIIYFSKYCKYIKCLGAYPFSAKMRLLQSSTSQYLLLLKDLYFTKYFKMMNFMMF